MDAIDAVLIMITSLAYWRRDIILHIIASIFIIFYGIDYTSTSMIYGILIVFFGIWTFIKGIGTRWQV